MDELLAYILGRRLGGNNTDIVQEFIATDDGEGNITLIAPKSTDKTLTIKDVPADAQATGDAINTAYSVGSRGDRQSSMTIIEYVNMYNKDTRLVDTGINANTGATAAKSGWDTSDYIPVAGGTTYVARIWNNSAWSVAPISNSNSTLYAVYDAKKKFISSGAAAQFTTTGITVPSNAAYLRIMCRKNTIATAPETLVFTEVDHFPRDYVAYGEPVYEWSDKLEHGVSGTDPVIVAQNGHKYFCGPVSTLTFTPSSRGMCSVRFTSGTSATILNVTSEIKWPSWFNPDSLETNTTYELIVSDNTLGVVGTWT